MTSHKPPRRPYVKNVSDHVVAIILVAVVLFAWWVTDVSGKVVPAKPDGVYHRPYRSGYERRRYDFDECGKFVGSVFVPAPCL